MPSEDEVGCILPTMHKARPDPAKYARSACNVELCHPINLCFFAALHKDVI